MKDYIKRTAGKLAVAAFLAVGLSMASCSEDIVIDNVDEGDWSSFKTSFAMLQSAKNPTRHVQTIELRGDMSVEAYVRLTKAIDVQVSVDLEIASELVAAYNDENYTEYELFPAANVSIGGPAVVAKWQTQSAPVTISFTYPTVEEGAYLLPVRATTSSADIAVSENSQVIYYFIKVMGSIPDNTKYVPGSDPARAIQTLCYVEVNGADLRNVGIYELANSGKKFFDMCVIFAANIKCDSNGRVFLHINENITHILDHADVYIKPLQDQGIKVLMGLLGGGDFAGLSSLKGESLRDFAQQVKNLVDVYNLDGIDFDDEWSSYDTSTTSMWAPSGTQLARLVIESRRIMPDKIITVFEYNYGRQMTTAIVDGVAIADQIDYSMQAIYGSYVTNSYIAGMPHSKYSPFAYWINSTSASTLNNRTQSIRSGAYGFFFCYDLNERDATTVLSTASNNLYDEPVVRIQDSYLKSF